MRSSKTVLKTSSVASAVWHVAPSCRSQMLPISSSSIFVNKTIAFNCNDLFEESTVFEEKWPNYASGAKSTQNSDSFWVRRLFNVCMRVFCGPNMTILLVYMNAKIKKSFIGKDDFFLPKSTSSVSRSQAHLSQHCSSVYTTIFVRRKDKTNYR